MKSKLILLCLLLVLPARAASVETWQERTLAAVLCAEAGGEGLRGIQAVAEIVINRHELSGRPVISIITEQHRGVHVFSCLNGKTKDQLWARMVKHGNYKTALAVAQQVYRQPQALPRRINGATHYDRKGAYPWWSRGGVLLAEVGNHWFWKIKT